MILSDRDIKHRLAGRGLVIEPLTEENIEPCSVDLTLADVEAERRMKRNERGEIVLLSWYLDPGEFALACTRESIRIPDDLAAFVHGKSSLGRQGLFVENAGLVDPGFEGQITLELFNASSEPVILTPGQKICQVVFHKLLSPCAVPYGDPRRKSRYQHQTGVTGPREEKP